MSVLSRLPSHGLALWPGRQSQTVGWLTGRFSSGAGGDVVGGPEEVEEEESLLEPPPLQAASASSANRRAAASTRSGRQEPARLTFIRTSSVESCSSCRPHARPRDVSGLST